MTGLGWAGADPEVPPVPWRPAGPVALDGLRVAYSPGYPPSVDPEIRAGADRVAAELDKLGAVVEDRLPDPALAGYGQLVAGDKAGQWDAWYRTAIPLAEQLYEDYLKDEGSR